MKKYKPKFAIYKNEKIDLLDEISNYFKNCFPSVGTIFKIYIL